MNNLQAALLVAVILVGSLLLLSWATQPTMDAYKWNEEAYMVKAGDTLWTIAGAFCPENVDRREWIDAVQELNGLDDSIIHPYQKLTVLVPAK